MSTVPVSVLDLAGVAAGSTTSDALTATVELAQAADRLGAHRFWVAEHHNMAAVAATNPPVLIAAVAARTNRIRVGSGGVMLPNHSPYVVAEQFAMLEALYPGRIDLGIGRAPGADPITSWALRRTQEGLGHEEFTEHVRLVDAWLSPAGVRAGMGHTLRATPAAASYPEIWLLGSSDYSARLAAQLGMSFAYAGHFGQLDPADVIGLYRSGFRPSPTLAEPRSMLCTSALVGATPEEARFLAGPSSVQWLNLRRDVREPIPSPAEAERRLAELGDMEVGGTKVVGTPEEVRERLASMVAASGADELMIVTTAFDVTTRIETLAAVLE
ncbi:LLM class flavin-dependent oxidoreductase [Propioniciclava coleopterorum]|uniref:LLM class flavin-dependent oxidoreductase n=1 Tax=Propioniciclava coleopterorum TaxID=2714937 RepID=A0A6G7Y9U4_9ACTN|nr:LLM class flavin-dependent oxidoreductase [Propioniciclava coleopterorum]QIK73418.1 LLM class flavin-dependent oxidoreductase [Propioniciclava coleopterorum]